MNVDWAGFLPVMIVLTLLPGADVAVVVRQTIRSGRRSGIATAVGINVGCLVWAVAFSFGLVGLLQASAQVYDVVRLAGAAYLVVLGLLSLRSALRRTAPATPLPDAADVPVSTGRWAGFRIGLLTNLLNPKIGLFFAAMLPQFLDPSGFVLGQALVMTASWNVCGMAWLSLVAWGISSAGPVLLQGLGKRIIDGVSGTVLCVVGARLARSA